MLGRIFVWKLSTFLSVTKYEHATPKPTHILIKFRDPRNPHLFDTVKEARYLNPLPTPGNPDFSRSGKSAVEFAQEPSQFARMAPGPSRRRGRPAPPTPRIWLTAGALLAVACQGGGERPLETSAGLSLDP